jgi:VanZ family protein
MPLSRFVDSDLMLRVHPPGPRSRRLRAWFALVVWCALIFTLSAQPNLELTDHELLDLVARKLAHATVFGILALLASMTFRQEGIAPRTAIAMGFMFAVLYAVSDEWHQSFVAGRVGSVRDVAIDTAGAGIAWVSLMLRLRRPAGLEAAA